MEDGSGLAKLIPSLAISRFLKSKPDSLVCLIRIGLEKNEATGQQMPGNTIMNDVELANLINYLRQVYSSDSIAVTTKDINNYLLRCKPRG